MLHSHLAKPPVPLCEVNQNIPVALSNIMMKLLTKNAEDRYQSAYGLKADLLECQRQWREDSSSMIFHSAKKIFQIAFRFRKSCLEGKAKSKPCFLHMKTASEEPEFFHFFGFAGIGKSSLVNELQIPVTQNNGYFISGRYAISENQVPYSALIEAIEIADSAIVVPK